MIRLPWLGDLGLFVLIGLFTSTRGAKSLVTFISIASTIGLLNLLTDGF